MQFHVPQYIDIEDKIFGKFSLSQVVYLGGGAGVGYMIFVKVFFPLNFLLAGGIGLFAAALAFFPAQTFGKPFIQLVEAAFHFIIGTKLYTWKRSPKKNVSVSEVNPETLIGGGVSAPNIAHSKLKDLSWNIDVGAGEQEVPEVGSTSL